MVRHWAIRRGVSWLLGSGQIQCIGVCWKVGRGVVLAVGQDCATLLCKRNGGRVERLKACMSFYETVLVELCFSTLA